MNPSGNGKALSEFLEAVVTAKLLDEEVALVANELPTNELQEQALDFYGDSKRVMHLIVRELLRDASGKIINAAVATPVASIPAYSRVETASFPPEAAGYDDKKIVAGNNGRGVTIWQRINESARRSLPAVIGWSKKRSVFEWVIIIGLVISFWQPFWGAVGVPVRWAIQKVTSSELPGPSLLTTTPPLAKTHSAKPTHLHAAAKPNAPSSSALTYQASSPAAIGRGSIDSPPVTLPAGRQARGNGVPPAKELHQQSDANGGLKKPSFLSSFAKNLVKNADGERVNGRPLNHYNF